MATSAALVDVELWMAEQLRGNAGPGSETDKRARAGGIGRLQ